MARKGLSTVLSSLIICSVVIAIGASVWSVTQSVASITGSSYYESVIESVGKIKERFCIENIILGSADTLEVWVFNYGSINVTIQQILVKGNENVSSNMINLPIASGNIARINLTLSNDTLRSGLSISIEVVSSRGNGAYDSIFIP